MAQSDSSKQGLTPQDELRSASRQIYAVSSELISRVGSVRTRTRYIHALNIEDVFINKVVAEVRFV